MYSFAKMCRLCLGGDCEPNKLISCEQINISLFNKLSTMFPKLDNTKTFPKWMCQNCQWDVNTTYNFYERCLSAQKKLEEYYDFHLKSSMLLNDKTINNHVDVQVIQPETEAYENKEIQLPLVLPTNLSGIAFNKEIECSILNEAQNKSEEYYSSLLLNDKTINNVLEVQVIQPETEAYENKEIQLSLLLSTNSSGVAINEEIECSKLSSEDQNKSEEYVDYHLKSLLNGTNINNYEDTQIIQPQSEISENKEIQLPLLLSTNSSVADIKKEIFESSQLNEAAINLNPEKRNVPEIELNAILSHAENIVAKTEIADSGSEYSEYNLTKTELNIDSDNDCSDHTENDSNTEENSATYVPENTQLIHNSNQVIENTNQIFNSDNLFKLDENDRSKRLSFVSFDGFNLKVHNIRKNGEPNNSSDNRYQCHYCTVAFTMEEFLKRHLKRIHNYTAIIPSPLPIERIENFLPAEPKKFKYSVGKKTSSRPMRYRCSLCDKHFCDQNQLKIHHRTHTGERPYTCEICKKGFSVKNQLARHLRSHSNKRPDTCDICHKSFSAGYLNVHKRIHTGELPFSCPMCGERFSRTDKVGKHIRMKHTKERPFLCAICDTTFNDQSNLRKHQRKYHTDIVE